MQRRGLAGRGRGRFRGRLLENRKYIPHYRLRAAGLALLKGYDNDIHVDMLPLYYHELKIYTESRSINNRRAIEGTDERHHGIHFQIK